MQTFGEEVARLMKEKGVVQTALAKACGVNQTFISKIVRGASPRLGADTYLRLCHALGVSCDHFRAFLAADLPAPAKKPTKPKGKK